MKRHMVGSSLSILLLVLFLAGCSPKEVKEEPTLAPEASRARQIEPEARALYGNAEKAFTAKNYDQALRLFQQIKSRYPNGRAQVYSSYRMGIIYYYKERYPLASKEFEAFLARMPQSDLAFDASYNWAACEYQQGHFDRTYQILSRLKLSEVQAQGPRRAETVYQLTARTAAALGNNAGAVAAHALQLQLPLEEGVRVAVSDKIDDYLGKINDRSALETLLKDVSEPETRRKISTRLAAYAPSVSSTPPGGAYPNLPTTVLAPPGSEGPARIELPTGGTSGQRFNVGVILPLSGKWAPYGRKALDGIMLASRVFGGEDGFRLFVQDSGSNPNTAAAAVDELVQRKDVMAIIGPLSYKEAVSVAERSQQLGVLNLSLASREGISEKGPYLFQNALTPRVQLESLVRYCVAEKGMKRFAILAPNNSFGKDMASGFWDLVERMGGKVVAHHTYAPDEKDFQQHIAELAGLSNMKFRRFEATKLADYIKEVKEKTKKEPKSRLPGIVDYDAIFIPDSPKAIAQIAPSLAYFDVTGISLLGTTEWNSDQFFSRGGKYVEGAIFPAGLHLNTRIPRAREFIKMYQEAYGNPPDLLATQSYEAMELIATAIRQTSSGDRNAIVNQLLSMKEFATPLGALTFDAQRIARRQLSILTLQNGGAVTEHY